MTAPTILDLTTAQMRAQSIADNCHAIYWLKGTDGNGISDLLMRDARDRLHELAALFGFDLVAKDDREPAQVAI